MNTLNASAIAAQAKEAKATNSAEQSVTNAFARTLAASAAEDTALEHVPAQNAPIADPATYMNAPILSQAATQPVFTPQPTQTPATSLPGLPGGSVSPQTAAAMNAYHTVKLTTAVESYGDMVSEINFREPTWRDTINCGAVMKTFLVEDEDGTKKLELQENFGNAIKWFTKLSGMNKNVFYKLSRTDGAAVMQALQIVTGDDDSLENFQK